MSKSHDRGPRHLEDNAQVVRQAALGMTVVSVSGVGPLNHGRRCRFYTVSRLYRG